MNEPRALTPADIAADYAGELTTQTYEKQPVIDGVRLVDMRHMVDDGGSFAEVLRLDDQGFSEAFDGFQVRQTSFSLILPGAVKAFHLHYRQDDIWFVPPDCRLLVGLLDARAASSTTGKTMRLSMGAGRAQLLFIPRGVAHGVTNLTTTPGAIFYFVNQQFDIADPDERRLPWDVLGEEFWRMAEG